VESNSLNLSNAPFVEELYESWKRNPEDVPDEWATYFQSIDNGGGAAPFAAEQPAFVGGQPSRIAEPTEDPVHVYKQSRVDSLLWAYRDIGYIHADLNPLSEYTTPELHYMYFSIEGNYEGLSLKEYGLSEDDLDREFSAGRYLRPSPAKLRDILSRMQRIYCDKMGVEILHIQNKPIRRWLIEKLESPEAIKQWTAERKIRFQKDLIKAEEFEHFVQSNFIGQKRFSLEGGEALIPALHYLITSSAQHGLQEIVLGMAHRGRLNVFTNALRKPAHETFGHFTENYQPHVYGGSGDVKYHLGHSFDYVAKDGDSRIHISLVANPSHLESVDPVVEGKARGIQRRRGDVNRKKVLPVLIHGDAAFSGQGVVSETFNLSLLPGYRTGGTVHIVLNNQIGFTTASRDARSTFFATDVAKSNPFPIFHVNGDYPEEVVRAIDLAMRFRQKFGYDAIVDILCYRRLGHNEADEPSFTHPIMYDMIKQHDSVTTRYGNHLAETGDYSDADQKQFQEKYVNVLKQELQKAKEGEEPTVNDAYEQGEWRQFTGKYSFDPVDTTVSRETLDFVADRILTVPDNFSIHPKLKRFVTTRRKNYDAGSSIDWAFAESLSFGSLLLEGYPIRLSGEDSARGTFSQRHAEWWDVESSVPKTHVPLKHLSEDQAPFSVYDSPLSEFGVLGFDYGYSLAQPNILTLWEAQFGDFVNGAQVIIDQFISAGEKKWFRSSGLVMLLPHGFEGQGPEHSSAHLERFLQLCAEQNLQVVNATTPAQYFHLLRKQMKQSFRKPLIVMTPKSLLRSKDAVSAVDELAEGGFRFVLDDESATTDAERVILCSGKVFYDLRTRREEIGDASTAILRLEQFYPFPAEALEELLTKYKKASELLWVQEEPENRGGWTFVKRQLEVNLDITDIRYVGRPESASPATGSHNEHQEELSEFLSQALPDD
jgi:2-oxoglutarate dehydrogenase E1 component